MRLQPSSFAIRRMRYPSALAEEPPQLLGHLNGLSPRKLAQNRLRINVAAIQCSIIRGDSCSDLIGADRGGATHCPKSVSWRVRAVAHRQRVAGIGAVGCLTERGALFTISISAAVIAGDKAPGGYGREMRQAIISSARIKSCGL
jgi:hypothetical protein